VDHLISRIGDRWICGCRLCPRKDKAGAKLCYHDLHDDLQLSVRELPIILRRDQRTTHY